MGFSQDDDRPACMGVPNLAEMGPELIEVSGDAASNLGECGPPAGDQQLLSLAGCANAAAPLWKVSALVQLSKNKLPSAPRRARRRGAMRGSPMFGTRSLRERGGLAAMPGGQLHRSHLHRRRQQQHLCCRRVDRQRTTTPALVPYITGADPEAEGGPRRRRSATTGRRRA